MHFPVAILFTPLLASLVVASPLPQGTAPGTVAVSGPEPDCYYPHGEDAHEMICSYTSDQPDHYPVITSSIPDSCGPDEEDGADIVCHLPSEPNLSTRAEVAERSIQAPYAFKFYCNLSGCHWSTHPDKKVIQRREAQTTAPTKFDFSKAKPIHDIVNTSLKPKIVDPKLDLGKVTDAYELTIKWKRDAEAEVADSKTRREAKPPSYSLTIRIRVTW